MLPELPKGMFADLAVAIAEHLQNDPDLLDRLSAKQQQAWTEGFFLPFLLKAGWDRDIAIMRAGSYARLFVLSWAEVFKKSHDAGERRAQARRLLAIAAGIGKIQNLRHRDALRKNAALVAKEIRAVALHIDWHDAEKAAAVFDGIAQGSQEELPRSQIIAVLDRVNQLTENYSAIAVLMATPERRGLPRGSRRFGLVVELLAQEYFRREGWLARDEIHQNAGWPKGEFFELVASVWGRPVGQKAQKAFAVAIKRAIHASPRVPTVDHLISLAPPPSDHIKRRARAMIERDTAKARQRLARAAAARQGSRR
jgi:hypothetical protein